MRSLVTVLPPARRPRLRAQIAVMAVSLSACAAALLAGQSGPAIATHQIVIFNDLQAGQAAPTVVTAPPVRPPLTASR